jgi:hypothetical protein
MGRATKARGSPTAHHPKAIPRAPLVRGRKCPATNAVKTFCLTRTKLHVCESIDALHKTALHPALFKNRKRERQTGINADDTQTAESANKQSKSGHRGE